MMAGTLADSMHLETHLLDPGPLGIEDGDNELEKLDVLSGHGEGDPLLAGALHKQRNTRIILSRMKN